MPSRKFARTKVINLNLNGIRSAHSKGAFDWLQSQNADVVLLQEVRALEHQLPDLTGFGHAFWHPASKPGYSGVGAICKTKPKAVHFGIGSDEFDAEGRVVRLEFEGWSAMSVYVPSGSSGPVRQEAKMRFLESLLAHLDTLKAAAGGLVVAGDFNIAHREIDLKNWRSNQQNSGFLPEERRWIDALLALGFVDVFRHLIGDVEHYSWWSNRGRARENNVGWRLDYQFCTPELAERAQSASIFREQVFSDHAPVLIEYTPT